MSLAVASGKSCELNLCSLRHNTWTDRLQYLKLNGGYTFAGSYVCALLTTPISIDMSYFPRNSCVDLQSVSSAACSAIFHADRLFSSLTGWIPEVVSFQRFGSVKYYMRQ